MNANSIAWILLLLPALVAIAILPGRKRAPGICALLTTGSAFICLILALLLSFSDWGKGESRPVPWIFAGESEGSLRVIIGLELDRLSRGMMIALTAIGFATQGFFLIRMKDDDAQFPPFAETAFFLFAATGIVFADGLVMMFFFWSLAGIASYLTANRRDHNNRGFLISRSAASGFLLGLLLLWTLTKSIYFREITPALEGVANRGLLDFGVLLLFFGTIGQAIQISAFGSPFISPGKSVPLLVLGGYTLARINPIISAAGTVATVIIWISAGAVLLFLLRDAIKFIPRKS